MAPGFLNKTLRSPASTTKKGVKKMKGRGLGAGKKRGVNLDPLSIRRGVSSALKKSGDDRGGWKPDKSKEG